MALARVTVTVPAALLREADRLAAALDRSRSWVVAEALRSLLTAPLRPSGRSAAALVREDATAPYLTGRDPQRLAQLEADLALTPEQRVREAERTVRDAEAAASSAAVRPPRVRAIRSFDRYEDFVDWRVRDLVP
jgi:hypothetical protein